MRRSKIIVAVVAAAAVTWIAAAGASSRSGSPSTDWAHALAIEKDGRIVVAGMSRRKSSGADNGFALARYTRAGHLDGGFGRGGKLVTSFPSSRGATAVAVLADGKIVAAGEAWTLARYTRGGSLDSSFGRGGTLTTDFGLGKAAYRTVRALAVQPDGKIVAVGACWRTRGPSYLAVARYTAVGKLDPTFARGGTVLSRFSGDTANAVAIQPDGRIVVAGNKRVVRYTSRGSLDSSFGAGGTVQAPSGIDFRSLALQPDGKIVVAGGPSDFVIVRYDGDGRLDTAFGDRGKAVTNFGEDPTGSSGGSTEGAAAVAVQADGKIVATGSTDVRGTFCGGRHLYGLSGSANMSICRDVALARYDADGSPDASFGDGGKVVTASDCCRSGAREGSASAEALAIQRDGKIVVAGLGPGYDFGVLRYTTRGRLDGSFGSGGRVSTDFGSG